jgi:2-aminoethylphosphonate-pyruvate transaminase
MRCILLNPGPVSLSQAVRKAVASDDLCHREPEFLRLQERVRQGLLDVYDCDDDEWIAILLGGAGTTALEAMLSSLVPRDAHLLVIENGIYGERISRIARIHGIESVAVEQARTDPIDFEKVESLIGGGRFTHLAAVHHEPATGRLNDVARLAEYCEQHGVELLLDTVSSFGAEDIPFRSPSLGACAITANECLHGIPGLCAVVCRKTTLQNSVEPPRSLSMHLMSWEGKQDGSSTPFTPPVNALLALDTALRELAEQGGWQARHARYSRLAGQVKYELNRLGVFATLPEGESSCVLTSYEVPDGKSYQQIHDGLRQWGFVIHTDQHDLDGEVFRISTMGDITRYDMERLLAALTSIFSS